MLGTPVDAWYLWIGTGVVALAILGIGLSLPSVAPPDAVGPAETVDRTAAHSHPATAEHPIDADEIRIGADSIELRTGDKTSTHRFLSAPVTPADNDETLESVMWGTPPEHRFDSPKALQNASVEAQRQEPEWRPAGDRVFVRTVHWGEHNVTLVGA